LTYKQFTRDDGSTLIAIEKNIENMCISQKGRFHFMVKGRRTIFPWFFSNQGCSKNVIHNDTISFK